MFSNEDLPTFGRPIRAMRRGPPTAVPKVCAGGLRQRFQDGVQHVAGAAAVQGGDRVRLAEAEGPQVGRVRLAAQAVDLVGAQHDRLAGLAQQPYDGLVGVGRADLGVHDEDDGVGGLDRVLGLRGHRGVDTEDVLLRSRRCRRP
ncbi:hypothetical protein GCM10017687_11310 [Streptomyces echinatus]